MDGEKRRLANIPFTEAVEKLTELNIVDEDIAALNGAVAALPIGVTTLGDLNALPAGERPVVVNAFQNQLGQILTAEQPVAEQNIPTTQVAGQWAPDQSMHYDPIPWIGVGDDNVANLNESVEETQIKVDALKPGEHIKVPIRHILVRAMRLAAWHFTVGNCVVHAGFDITKRFIVCRNDQNQSEMTEIREAMVVGNGRCAVWSNTELKSFASFKAAAKIYSSSKLHLLRQEEKHRKYRQRTDAIIAEMRSQLAQLWYSPGMPGAKEASEHFASIKPDEEPFY